MSVLTEFFEEISEVSQQYEEINSAVKKGVLSFSRITHIHSTSDTFEIVLYTYTIGISQLLL